MMHVLMSSYLLALFSLFMTRAQCCEKVVQTPQQGLRLNRRPGYQMNMINL
jgi:hypothetical protein